MTEPSSGFTTFVLGQLMCAGLRTRLQTCEIDNIVTALSGNFIGTDDAIKWMDEIGAGHLLIVPSSVITPAST